MGLFAYLFGKSSEDRACEFLLDQGFEILERNFKSRFGEIDIIAKDKMGVLCFVEVKATSTKSDAGFRLTAQKYAKILKAVDYYLLKNAVNSDFELSLLVINEDKIELIRNISF